MFHNRTTEEVYQEYLSKGGEPMSKVEFCRSIRKAYPEFEIKPARRDGKVVRVFCRVGEKLTPEDRTKAVKAVFG